MAGFRLTDWNDARLLLACAEHGSFAAAGAALGIDQTTVSRRIGLMEAALGRPLFTRRRSGAQPTAVGQALIERARIMRAAAEDIEAAMGGLAHFPPPTVSVGASEGLLTYTLIPVLLGNRSMPQPIDTDLIRGPLPDFTFTTDLTQADIAIAATSIDAAPSLRGPYKVRRIGTMHFAPAAARRFLKANPGVGGFGDLDQVPLVNVSIYGALSSLGDWNGLIAGRVGAGVTTTAATPIAHQALLDGLGVGLLPVYSSLYDERVVVLDQRRPPLGAALWLVAHADRLREPAIREVYDLLGTMFSRSPWFKEQHR